MTLRPAHERHHGAYLASGDTEALWGWDTPAGRLRATRRGTLIAHGAGLRPGLAALEIGCGTGLFTAMFAQTGAHITAIDISPELLEKAHQRELPADRVAFQVQNLDEYHPPTRFDAVIGSSVLHHLDIAQAFPRIYTLLKPGGLMSFAEPNMLNPQIFCERTCRWMFPYVSPDEMAFVRWHLDLLLRLAGFDAVEITPFDWLHPSTPEPLIPFVRATGRWLESLPGVCEFAGSLFIRCRKPHDPVS